MHRALTIAAMAAAAISPLAGCGDDARDGESADRPSGELAPAETAAGFGQRMALTDLYEIAAGRLGVEQAASPEVRRFAETMVSDHQRIMAELQAEIARQGLRVSAPTRIDAPRQDRLADLRASQGGDFDERYIDQQIEAHDNALRVLREYAETGDSPALKDWARRTAPRVENHRQMAIALDRLDAGGSAPAAAAGAQRR